MSISKRTAKNKNQKKVQKAARKVQNQGKVKKTSSCKRKKLTTEQKRIRSLKLIERKEWKEKRRKIDKEKEETPEIKLITDTIMSIFHADTLEQLGKATAFIKKPGQITALAFVYIISFGFLGNGKISLICLAKSLSKNFGILISPQALSKRINSIGSVKLLRCVLKKLIESQLKIGVKNKFSEMFPMFSAIYLEDSSQMLLHDSLASAYNGNGRSSKSGIKLDFIYDIKNLLVHGLKVTPSRTNDQSLSKEILKYIKPKSLVIRDLGYFGIDSLRRIGEASAYYLSRLSMTTYVYLNKDDVEPVDVIQLFKTLRKQGKDFSSFIVYIGKTERLETRLVAEKVPKSVIAQRKARFKDERCKEPSEYFLEWCGYSIFITNIPVTMFSSRMIIALYKLRWQVELVFKNFKSNIEIHILKGKKKNRIDSLVYGKLISIMILYIIHNYATHIAKEKEVSGDKLTKYLITENNLRNAILNDGISMLLILMGYDLKSICKQKKTKKTTFEEIEEILKAENLVFDKETVPRYDKKTYFKENPLERVA